VAEFLLDDPPAAFMEDPYVFSSNVTSVLDAMHEKCGSMGLNFTSNIED